MIAETIGQCFLIGWMYTEEAPLAYGCVASAWFSACISALAWAVPLHAQRPLSVLLFLAAMTLKQYLPPWRDMLERSLESQWRVPEPDLYFVQSESYSD